MTVYFSSLLDLFFPRFCPVTHEKIDVGAPLPISLSAESRMTPTELKDLINPVMEKKFLGLFTYRMLLSSYYFVEGGVCQKIVHLAKYKGLTEVFEFYAREFVSRNREELTNEKIDLVVPVPANWTKKYQRGYNQAEVLSKSLAQELHIKHDSRILKKKIDFSSQTKKNKIERLNRLGDLYAINKTEHVRGKHVLLVDDVITSGATIETCSNLLYKAGAKIVSVYCFGLVK